MAPPPPLQPGLTLGPFHLEGKLAVGGMAEIWGAQGPDGPLALKVLRPELVADPGFVAMFEDEVRIATRLRHPNIVQVHGVHEVDGHVLQSMERIEGLDLRRLLSFAARTGRSVPVPLCLFVARELARALSHAHQRKTEDGRPLDIVHRDVSPHNVMLRLDGRVKLLDFGVARAAERAVKTRTGVIKGKLAYMAPEQALAVGVTPQTDIFAAGVVLWEMLTVERLFTADSEVELLERVVAAHVPSVLDKNPEVPEEIARLLDRMLAQRAPERPSSMDEVERTLTRALAVYYPPGAGDEAALAAWMRTEGLLGEPSDEADGAEVEDVTLSSGAPEPDVTATYVRPERQDETWAAPAPGGGEPTPHAPSALVAPPLPSVSEAPEPDVARTWVDMAPPDMGEPTPEVTAPGAGPDDPTPHDPTPHEATPPEDATPSASPAPARRPDKVRAPTRTEIIRAVESQATVEMEADADVAALAAQFVQVTAPPAERPVASTQQVEAPRRAPSAPAPGAPTLQGDLVPADLGPIVPIAATDVSGGYEPIGTPRAPAPAPTPSPATPAPAPAPVAAVAAPRSVWSWLLPGITLALAGLVLVLIFLLIRGQ